MPAPPVLKSPWKLAIPAGPTAAADGIRESVNSAGEYLLEKVGDVWLVERLRDPPRLWRELEWTIHRLGESGSRQALQDHLASWPTISANDGFEAADGMVKKLESSDKPEDAIKWAEAAHYASDALMTSPAGALVSLVERIARKLLDWFPAGQMLVWGKSHDYTWAGRPAHMLAGAGLTGLDGVVEGLRTGKGGIWMRGEDIVHAHAGSIYVNLINSEEMPGWAFETPAATFVFEFGTNIRIHPSLDFLSVRYLNSLPILDYLPANLPEQSPIIQAGVVGQDALRAWFLSGLNRLAEHLIRWESFTTSYGELQPVVQQGVNMSVTRILNTTAQLLASEERSSRMVAFGDLVDLYAGVTGADILRLFDERFWSQHVVPACRTLPAHEGALFERYANELYTEWVHQCVQGVTMPSRVFSSTLQVQPGGPRVPHSRYFARHMRARRNTLHGYDLRRSDGLELLAIHDGSLPQRLPEWGRMMLIALLADPDTFLGRYRRISA